MVILKIHGGSHQDAWDAACVATTFGTLLPVWRVIQRYQLRTVEQARALEPIELSAAKSATGWFGLLGFFVGERASVFHQQFMRTTVCTIRIV